MNKSLSELFEGENSSLRNAYDQAVAPSQPNREKERFEANMLDGDKLEHCGGCMISAESCFEYVVQALAEQRKAIVKNAYELAEREEKGKPKEYSSIYRHAIVDVVANITAETP